MMNISGSGMTAPKELSGDDKKMNQQKMPINTLAIGFAKSVGQDKKLNELSQRIENIDEKTIRDFAKHLNDVGHGVIISDVLIEKAIKGLQYKGDVMPELPKENTDFNKLDEHIQDTTQKMLTLNSALLVVNPNLILKNPDENMTILPVPVLSSQEEKLDTIFKDEKIYSDKAKSLLPQAAQEVFDKNYPVLRQTAIDDAKTDAIQNKIASVNDKDNLKISSDITDKVSDIYKMVAIRFLAQLGSQSTGVPSISLPPSEAKEVAFKAA